MGNVRLVEEVEHQDDRLSRIHSELQPAREDPRIPVTKPNHRESMMELMGQIAKILGIRMQLFFAFLGAAGIGAYAVYKADPMSLTAFGLYAVLIWLPMLLVAHKRG